MAFPSYFDEDAMMTGLPPGIFPPDLMRGGRPTVGGLPRRFDEYYRCYPVVMMSGPERENVNHGGKIIMPPSALDKLTRLHITYPMLFELINGNKEKVTHAGVLEFIAEEGRCYLPYWLMRTLSLEAGDLLQLKSTDLPPGRFIKLQAQSPSFLDISDPKAVLENAFRNFACLSTGDIFTFAYNDQVYEMAVLETKPENEKRAISVLETDLEVDFAVPLGYEEPKRVSGTSTPSNGVMPRGGTLHSAGTMAQAINYSDIAPSSGTAAAGAKATSSNFLLGGHKLNAKKNSKPVTPQASTPAPGAAVVAPPLRVLRKTNGPQPLRLPPGKLFFGYEVKPVRKAGEELASEPEEENPKFLGQGQTLRGGVKNSGANATPQVKEEKGKGKADAGRTLGNGGRTLRETPK